MSLRARLLVGLVALAALGLGAADVATYEALQYSLVRQVDDQMGASSFQVAGYLHDQEGANDQNAQGGFPGSGPPPGGGQRQPPSVPQGTFAELVAPSGTIRVSRWLNTGGSTPSGHVDIPSTITANPTTVAGTGSVSQYRLLVSPTGSQDGDLLVLAFPLNGVQSTLNQLLTLEGVVGAAVLIGTAVLAWLIVRVGLQPLERMGGTAAAIAAGDLSRRVEPATPNTEIGRLGLSLNAMLSQIERSFAERMRSEQRLRQFLADASHELRTPLTSIRGYAELLRGGAADRPEDAAVARRRIEAEAVRMSGLVDDLLLLARLDQGRPLDRSPVDLGAIARDACADARAVAPARAVSLDAPEAVVVTGDEMRLRQVVGNLVRNALVHTPAGTPVEIAVARSDGHAVLTIADHGPGLGGGGAPERVFEPFYRADPGRSRDRGGAGLGLSIVAAVVGAHGGTVEATETAGGGATFRVVLPAADQPAS